MAKILEKKKYWIQFVFISVSCTKSLGFWLSVVSDNSEGDSSDYKSNGEMNYYAGESFLLSINIETLSCLKKRNINCKFFWWSADIFFSKVALIYLTWDFCHHQT